MIYLYRVQLLKDFQMPHDSLLTLEMVCERVSLSASYIRKLIRAGKFPEASHVFGSRAVRWSESKISEWIENNRKTAVS